MKRIAEGAKMSVATSVEHGQMPEQYKDIGDAKTHRQVRCDRVRPEGTRAKCDWYLRLFH